MKLYYITVGCCKIPIVTTKRSLKNVLMAVKKTYPTQEVGYKEFETEEKTLEIEEALDLDEVDLDLDEAEIEEI